MIGIPLPGPRLRNSRRSWIPVFLTVVAGSAGPLTGQEILGTVFTATDSAVVPEAMVRLHRITSISGQVVDSTRADAAGRFRFTIEEAENPEVLYAAAVTRGGVSYFGPIIHAGMDPPGDYAIYVYEVESVDEPVTGNPVRLRHVVVSPAASGLLQVGEVVDVEGTPGRALRTTDRSIPVWSMALPRGFQAFEPIEGGIPPESISEAAGRVEARTPLPPQGVRIAFGYFIEGPDLDFPVEYATERFEIILVAAEESDLRGLTPAEVSELPPGADVRRFVASDLPPGSTVGLTIASESVAWTPVLISALIGVALLGAAAVSARRARQPTT
ncbi:MAG: hypothetical protein P8049_07110 [Gemmatimonadota bacterium]